MPDFTLGYESYLDASDFISSIRDMISSINDVSNASKDIDTMFDSAVEKSSNAADKISENMRKAFEFEQPKQMSQGEITDIFGSPMEKFTSGMGESLEKLTGLGPETLAIGAGFTVMAAGMQQAVSSAGNFEASMNKVSALTGESAKGLKDIAETASAGTTVGLDEAGQAMINLAENGARTSDMAKELSASITLAEAGSIGLGSATQILSTDLRQFNVSSEDSNKTVNMLVAAAIKGKTNVEDMGSAMYRAGPTAAAYGVSLEETTAAISEMTGQHMKSRQAGSAFTSMLNEMAQPSKQVAEGLSAIGISADEVDPRIHSLSDIIDTLKEHGVTASQAMEIFGRTAGPGVAALLSPAEGGFRKYTESIQGTNAATEAAEKASSGFDASMEKMGAAVEMAKDDLGTIFLPVLTSFITVIDQSIVAADKFGKAVYDMGGKAASGLAEVGQKASGGTNWLLSYVDKNILGNAADASGKEIADSMGKGIESEKDKISDPIADAAKEGGSKGGKAAADAFGDLWRQGLSANQLAMFFKGNESQGAATVLGTTTAAGIALRSRFVSDNRNTTFELTDNGGNILASSTATQLGIDNPGSASGRAEAIKKLIEKLGWTQAIGDIGMLNLEGEQGAASSATVQNTLKVSNLWSVPDSTRSIEKYMDQNKDIVKHGGEEMALVLMNAMNDDIVKKSPTLQESLSIVMKDIASPGSVPYDEFNTALQDIIDSGALGEAWKVPMENAAKSSVSGVADIFGNAINDALTKGVAGKDFLSGMFTEGGKLKKDLNVEDMTLWQKNVFKPEVVNEAKAYYEQMQTGATGTKEAFDEYINSLAMASTYQKDLFTPNELSAIYEYQNHLINADKFMKLFSTDTADASQKLSTWQDQSKWGAVSGFGAWQENNADLFYGGYIGPMKGSQYTDYLLKKKQEQAEQQPVDLSQFEAYHPSIPSNYAAILQQQMSGKAGTGAVGGTAATVGVKLNLNEAKTELEAFIKKIEASHPAVHTTLIVDVDAGIIHQIIESAVQRAAQKYSF